MLGWVLTILFQYWKNSFLPDGQHGFRAFRSTLSQLLSFLNTILDNLEVGGGVVYIDFSKAFYKVETGVRLHKVRECGVGGMIASWLTAFLDPNSQQQAVGVDCPVSSLSPVHIGPNYRGKCTLMFSI